MRNIIVNIIPQLKDNYSYIIESEVDYFAVIIDPAEVESHCNFLQNKNLKLDSIILTHHHHDHTSGVRSLLKKYPSAKVYSPNKLIDGTTNLILNNDLIKTPVNKFDVIATPGHTLDHIILYDKINALLFSGDTLFHLGCGRVFEGTFEQMYASLQKINNLPDKTLVYCGHEYTMNNLNFLESIFEEIKELKELRTIIEKKINMSSRTIPFFLGDEKRINPFLNQSSYIFDSFKKNSNLSNFEMFKFIREKKDNF